LVLSGYLPPTSPFSIPSQLFLKAAQPSTTTPLALGVLLLSVAVWLYLVRRTAAGSSFGHVVDLRGKTALVTGGNAGIGRETVGLLASMGAHVIMGARDPKRAAEAMDDITKRYKRADGSDVSLSVAQIDLSSLSSIQAFVSNFLRPSGSNGRRLDILVNNAGLGLEPQSTTKDGLDLIVGTNYVGHVYLTELLLPLIIKSKGKIINIASSMHTSVPQNFTEHDIITYPSGKVYSSATAYAISKLGNLLHANYLHNQYAKAYGISAFSLHPGGVDTDLFRRVFGSLAPAMKPLMWLTAKTPVEGAQTTLFCSVNPRAESGEYYADCRRLAPSKLGRDDVLGVRLHKATLETISRLGFHLPATL